MSDIAVLEIKSAGSPSSQEFCHVEWDVYRGKWRAWHDEGPLAFADQREIAVLRVFALHRFGQEQMSQLSADGDSGCDYWMLLVFALVLICVGVFAIGILHLVHHGL